MTALFWPFLGLFAVIMLAVAATESMFHVERNAARVVYDECGDPTEWIGWGWHRNRLGARVSPRSCPVPGYAQTTWLEVQCMTEAAPMVHRLVIRVVVDYAVGMSLRYVHLACTTKEDPKTLLVQRAMELINERFHGKPLTESKQNLRTFRRYLVRELNCALRWHGYEIVGTPKLTVLLALPDEEGENEIA